MTPLPPRFPPELVEVVQQGLDRRGFHFLSIDDLESLGQAGQGSRLEQVRAFAKACGARVETDSRLHTARLQRARRLASQEPVEAGFWRFAPELAA